jgi:plasmid replication initiation protein
MKIESDNLIVKSNQLIEANYRLSAGEQKILYKLIMSIDKNDTDFKSYNFRVSEFLELLNVKNRKKFSEVKKHTKNLMRKVFIVKDLQKKQELQIAWLSSALYKDGEGIVELSFSPYLKPYLLQLKDSFTQLDGLSAIQLRSSYSMRINELLQQYKKIGSRVFQLDDLRNKLGLFEDEYKLYGDFKRYVLKRAQKEINNHKDIDIYFDFEEVKTGKKVTAIKFIIHCKNKFKTTKIFVPEKDIIIFIDKFNKTFGSNLAGSEQTKKLVVDLMNLKGLEHFEDCLSKFPQVIGAEVKKGRIRSLEGLFMNFVKHGYNFNSSMLGQVGHEVNFEQREYTAKDFEKYYYKVPE